jgi:hypothetical protein
MPVRPGAFWRNLNLAVIARHAARAVAAEAGALVAIQLDCFVVPKDRDSSQ